MAYLLTSHLHHSNAIRKQSHMMITWPGSAYLWERSCYTELRHSQEGRHTGLSPRKRMHNHGNERTEGLTSCARRWGCSIIQTMRVVKPATIDVWRLLVWRKGFCWDWVSMKSQTHWTESWQPTWAIELYYIIIINVTHYCWWELLKINCNCWIIC